MTTVYWEEEIETLPRVGLESIQLKRLQRLVARVYDKVEPYRKKMDEAGVKPSDIQSLADLSKLPFDPLEFIEQLDELPFDPNGEPDVESR